MDTPTFGTLNYCVLFAYLVVMFGIGLWFSRKQKTTEDYFLAGRNMSWLIVSMSIFASLTSATSFMGIPGVAYKENISLIVMGLVSIVVAPFIIFLFYPFYRRLNVTTSYEYIAYRYGASARFTISALFVLARLGWLGVVIYSPALVLSVVIDINLYLAIILMGTLAVIYTVMGGLSAVLWTDFLQFIFLTGGAIWVAVSLVNKVPEGISGIIEIARQTDHFHVIDWKFSLFKMTGIVAAMSLFFQLMQDYGTDQVTVQRLMAIKDFRGMAKAVILNSFFDLLIISLLLFLGIGLFAYYQHFPQQLAEGLKADEILPHYIMQALPAGVSGLVITAIFAAAMSSMDSGINSLATVIVNDMVKPSRKKSKSEHHDVNLARFLTLILGGIAIVIACYVSTIEHIIKAATWFLGLFAAPVLALFLLGVLSRRSNFRGWLVGAVLAILTTIWLRYCTRVHFIYYFPFSFGISFVIGYMTSILFNRPLAPSEYTIWGRAGLKAK